MKPKRIKTDNQHQFMTRIPKTLFVRINAVRIEQNLTWAQLLCSLFEWHIAKSEMEKTKNG